MMSECGRAGGQGSSRRVCRECKLLGLWYESSDRRTQLVIGHRFVQKQISAGLRFPDAVGRGVAGDEYAGDIVIVFVAQPFDHGAADLVVAQAVVADDEARHVWTRPNAFEHL